MANDALLGSRLAKPVLHLLCLLPLIYIVWAALSESLGTDPVKALLLMTGEWSIRLLLVTLAVTPLRQWLNMPKLIRFRRMLGLYAWFYASLHFLAVLTYLFGWDWDIALEELSERPYIIVGFLAWLFMLPLGVTSNAKAIRALGRNWKKVHKLIYFVAVLAWVHVFWQVRSSYFDAVLYGALILMLFYPRLKKVCETR
ncbi:sulfite oxidase heme-binding subunit YedZ [Zhongshania guokunii]|uniref:Protein-methionine-sulfoxide reductase heme-binding subunit MsrQ n=1 Tax=Zhongshania guokunii TaxID=641783 RepID=A0ABV3UBX3_9GAMM